MSFEIPAPREPARPMWEVPPTTEVLEANTWERPFTGAAGNEMMLITPGSALADFAQKAAHNGVFAITEEDAPSVPGMREHDGAVPSDAARAETREVRLRIDDVRRAERRAEERGEKPAPLILEPRITTAVIKGLLRMVREGKNAPEHSLDAEDARRAQRLLDKRSPETAEQ